VRTEKNIYFSRNKFKVMIKSRIYKLEQDYLDIIKADNKSKGLSATNQSAVKVAVEKLVATIKRKNDESRR